VRERTRRPSRLRRSNRRSFQQRARLQR
jgi:hypothetical protein